MRQYMYIDVLLERYLSHIIDHNSTIYGIYVSSGIFLECSCVTYPFMERGCGNPCRTGTSLRPKHHCGW